MSVRPVIEARSAVLAQPCFGWGAFSTVVCAQFNAHSVDGW
ncbi:MAG: hypothetical protein QOH94_2906, partial [Mycobacterium sp.]|nr:hypothetical protein [Mycobacterium sp.]